MAVNELEGEEDWFVGKGLVMDVDVDVDVNVDGYYKEWQPQLIYLRLLVVITVI